MDEASAASSQLNSALFIDFDNIYSSLAEQDEQAAEKFANNPDRWLAWLERQLPMKYPGAAFTHRRILIRRCYLNPKEYSRHRPNFIRSACEVIDCPPLTFRGKTSTDIHMVMDILEALSHDTYFHEFIVLSGDADFTPVLLKLRKHARYSVVLSVGYASPAYRSSSDHLINQSVFLETALGITYQEDEPSVDDLGEINTKNGKLLRRMADSVYDQAMLPSGIPANDLPAIYKGFPEFRQSNHWLGFYSLRRLTEALVDQRDDLVIDEDEDSWFVARSIVPEQPGGDSEERRIEQPDAEQQDLQGRVAGWIKNRLGASATPIVLSALAQSVIRRFAGEDLGSNWLGAGTFKNLLRQLDLGNLRVADGAPGYLYDPDRHSAPTNGQMQEGEINPPVEQTFSDRHPALEPLARKIHRLTDMPYLLPHSYGILFEEIAREVNAHGYQMTRTSRTVRDQCLERGAPIARSHVNFVLTGLYYSGYRLGDNPPESPRKLAELMVENTYKLCRAAQFELDADEQELVRQWLVSEVGEVEQ